MKGMGMNSSSGMSIMGQMKEGIKRKKAVMMALFRRTKAPQYNPKTGSSSRMPSIGGGGHGGH